MSIFFKPLCSKQIIRTILERHPQLYYKLPCEWNVQIYSDVASECCHVVWPLKYPDQIDCWSGERDAHTLRSVKLVHFDTEWKPDEMNRSLDLPDISTQIERKLSSMSI